MPLFTKARPKPAALSAGFCAGLFICLLGVLGLGLFMEKTAGTPIDALDGVPVYRNGFPLSSRGRTLAPDGYNIGLKYQCVEFVKRYYFEHYNHQMPDAYGHAASFFEPSVPDGGRNKRRGLIQYANGGKAAPQKGDILVFAPAWYNPYGHVAVVAKTGPDKVEYIQQNTLRARDALPLSHANDGWTVRHKRLLGWLRKPAAGDP